MRISVHRPAWLRLPRPSTATRRPPAAAVQLPWSLRVACGAALALMALITVGASGMAMAESYRDLYLWAAGHGVPGAWAAGWPLTVDAFIVLPEIALFYGMVKGWSGWSRVWPWIVVAVGLLASVLGNVGHVKTATITDRFTWSVPPLAAFIGLTIALGVLKRIVAGILAAAEQEAAAAGAAPANPREVVAHLVARGVDDTGQLAAVAGVAERTARTYKREAKRTAEAAAAATRPPAAVQRPSAAADPASGRTHRHAAGSPRLTSVETAPL